MRSRNFTYVMLMMAAVLFFAGCGDESDDPGMFLSGTYIIDAAFDTADAPVLVALTRSIDNDLLENNPRDAVIEYMVADSTSQSFRMDLSGKNIGPDDRVYLIAFVDTNYAGAVPFPDAGDVIGVYAEADAISPAIRLDKGENDGYDITINREVFDYEASISGTILGDDAGEVTIVAYCGDIDSSDFTALDLDVVVGYKTLTKKSFPLEYTLDILPYGKNAPIENVQIFALLDANGSEAVDAGDKIGFYSDADDFSTPLTIKADMALENIDIDFSFDVKAPCGSEVILSGDFSLPEDYTEASPPVYIAVFDGKNPGGVLDDPFSSIVYFSKVPGGETEFSFDLSDTGICPGDEVLIVGLWDRDFTGGLPNFTTGDFIGIYAEEGRISPSVVLGAGENTGFEIDISREVFDYEASISGTILGDDAGAVTLVAYCGDIESSDFTTLDFNDVVGFTTITKGNTPLGYTLDILPYGKNAPIENVQIFALLDANGSEAVDAGDKIGFYSDADDFSTPLTIKADMALENIDIDFSFDVKAPCGSEVILSGDFSLPEDYTEASPPVYIAVFDGKNPGGVLDDPFSSIVYFSKVPGGETEFSFDLSDTGICPGDEVLIVGLWDRDFTGGLPNFTTGDFIGIYAEEGRISPSVVLGAGENTGFEIDISREVFDYEASISGTILGDDAGAVTLVAYCGDIESSDFTTLDFNDVVGFTTITKGNTPLGYTLDILPYGKNAPIENVQIFALLDANGSEAVDAGDKIGFYSDADDFSTPLTIKADMALENIDIDFSFDVKAPCGSEVILSGDFSLPEDYTEASPPVYIAVFDGKNPGGVLDDPFSSIVYFSKVPGGETEFSFDLSDTGICPGDEVLIVGLWDRDFTGGLPNFTTGDFIGIYAEEGKISPAVTLGAGENSGFDIRITREVFDYEASISGTILGDDAGEVTLVAYCGDIESSDFTALDFNDVVGFKTVNKKTAPLNYTLDFLPYGKNVPMENVQIFALLDANSSQTVDGGDKIGLYGRDNDFSSLLTINAGTALTDIDIEFKLDIKAPCGIQLSVSGKISMPDKYALKGPIYVAIFDASDPAGVLDDPFASILYFSKLPGGATDYFFDLSDTGICPGDEIMIVGLWDRDFTGGFPDISLGDFIGIYAQSGGISPAVDLNPGHNEGVDIFINREVFDYQASISGTLLGSDAGNVILVAYAGEVLSSDFTTISFNDVIGYETVTKTDDPVNYKMDILPYGKNVPIRDVQVFALLDANNSGSVDSGDRIGFYSKGDEYSTLLDINAGAALKNIDIAFTFDVQGASGFDMSITGAFTVPGDYVYGGAPVFVLVFDSDNPADILTDPFSYLKFFYRVPENDNYFDIDLSGTDLSPGDEVIIAALWDRDFTGGLPNPTEGDRLGLLINEETYQFTTQLNCGKNIIPPYGYEFKISKNIYDINACIEYAIDLSGVGSYYSVEAQLLIFAIHVDGVEVAVSTGGNIELYIDLDYLLGVDVISPVEYDYIGIGERTDPSNVCGGRCLPILTALDEKVVVWRSNRLPEPLIKGVDHGKYTERTAYLVAVLDKNGNGRLDNDDEIGYYGNYVVEIIEDKFCVNIPWLGDILIPDSFIGSLQFPAPIKRIVWGRNQEQREDGTCGPYWISNFIENF